MEELLFPEPTARTPRFDAYTEGSYHVDAGDLARSLPDHARACGLRLSALLVVGPIGPLWTYYVAVLIDRGEHVQLNTVVMPHARITGKGTGVLTQAEAASRVRAIAEAAGGRAVVPPTERGQGRGVLLVTFGQDKPESFRADIDPYRGGRPAVLDAVNALLRASQRTYPAPEPAK